MQATGSHITSLLCLFQRFLSFKDLQACDVFCPWKEWYVGALAARAQEGREELLHVQGQEGQP